MLPRSSPSRASSWRLALLLASTSLCAIRPASAEVVLESDIGVFGRSFATATQLLGPSSTIYGDVDQSGRGPDFFSVAGPYTGFTLDLITSRVSTGTSIGSASGGAGAGKITALDNILQTTEGGSVIVPIPSFGGSGSIEGASALEGTSLLLGASNTPSSYSYPGPDFYPVITFYDDGRDFLGSVTITEGNSIAITGMFSSPSDLDFSINTPFNYQVQLDPINAIAVPEPASAALLGFGALGAALARRRKRVL